MKVGALLLPGLFMLGYNIASVRAQTAGTLTLCQGSPTQPFNGPCYNATYTQDVCTNIRGDFNDKVYSVSSPNPAVCLFYIDYDGCDGRLLFDGVSAALAPNVPFILPTNPIYGLSSFKCIFSQ